MDGGHGWKESESQRDDECWQERGDEHDTEGWCENQDQTPGSVGGDWDEGDWHGDLPGRGGDQQSDRGEGNDNEEQLEEHQWDADEEHS